MYPSNRSCKNADCSEKYPNECAERSTNGVLRETQSALLLQGVQPVDVIPSNSLVRFQADGGEDEPVFFIKTGDQLGPGFAVTIAWRSRPPGDAGAVAAEEPRDSNEVVEVDVTCAPSIRVDALAGGDLTLDAGAQAARLRVTAGGRPDGRAQALSDLAMEELPVMERYILDLWPREHAQPPVIEVLNEEELNRLFHARRSSARGAD